MELIIDRNIYSDACISKAVYSLAREYVVNRSVNGFIETLHIKSLYEDVDEKQIEEVFLSALNDYKLRQIIEMETHDIRTILYAKAFSEFDDIEFENV